jgi:hypothetical protein
MPQCREPAWHRSAIVIQEGHHVATRRPQALVARKMYTGSRFRHPMHARLLCCSARPRIARSVVHHDHFISGLTLLRKCREAAAQALRTIT